MTPRVRKERGLLHDSKIMTHLKRKGKQFRIKDMKLNTVEEKTLNFTLEIRLFTHKSCVSWYMKVNRHLLEW